MTLSLFPSAQIPRHKYITRMHVMDAGSGLIEFECGKCAYNTGMIKDIHTVTENKRGLPCPICNGKGD